MLQKQIALSTKIRGHLAQGRTIWEEAKMVIPTPRFASQYDYVCEGRDLLGRVDELEAMFNPSAH